jgi:hypothetical protein
MVDHAQKKNGGPLRSTGFSFFFSFTGILQEFHEKQFDSSVGEYALISSWLDDAMIGLLCFSNGSVSK